MRVCKSFLMYFSHVTELITPCTMWFGFNVNFKYSVSLVAKGKVRLKKSKVYSQSRSQNPNRLYRMVTCRGRLSESC